MLPWVASVVTTLLQNNLKSVAQAVVDKGLEKVEEKLGIELKPNMTPEEIQKVQEAAMKHEEFLISQDNANTASAREMNTKIQEAEKASFLAKNTAFILDFCIVLSAIILTVLAFFVGIPFENKEIIYTLLGSLWTYAGVVINFHRGTTAGSARKTDILANIDKMKGK